VFSPVASLLAPAWVLERAVCSWLAVGQKVRRGGVVYGDMVIARAANSRRELRRRELVRTASATTSRSLRSIGCSSSSRRGGRVALLPKVRTAFSGRYRGVGQPSTIAANREAPHGIDIEHASPDGEDVNTEEDGEEGIVDGKEGVVDGEEGIVDGEEGCSQREGGREEDGKAHRSTAPHGVTEPPERE
jgi:hypothetical protein